MSALLAESPLARLTLVYQTGAVADDGAVLVVATEYARSEARDPHAHLLIFRDDSWRLAASVEYFCQRACWRRMSRPEWLVLGKTGAVIRVSASGAIHEERLYPPPEPLAMGTMHGICVAGDVAYAVGMRRQAFTDNGSGKWTSISDDMPAWPEPAPVVGFDAVDSFPDQTVYAVGWAGEIATRIDKRWERIDSPINRILTGVVCAGDGLVYACGQRGALLRGNRDDWEVMDPGIPPEDLWGVAWYDGALYASSLRSVFRLTENGLDRVDMGEALMVSCYHVSAAGQFLCSIGGSAIALFDARNWRLITPQ